MEREIHGEQNPLSAQTSPKVKSALSRIIERNQLIYLLCMHCPGKDLYSRNLELLVPFFECPSLALKKIEKVLFFYAVSGFSKNVVSLNSN